MFSFCVENILYFPQRKLHISIIFNGTLDGQIIRVVLSLFHGRFYPPLIVYFEGVEEETKFLPKIVFKPLRLKFYSIFQKTH